MKNDRVMWVLVAIVVLTTIAITFGTLDGKGQEKVCDQAQATPTPVGPFGDFNKYPTVDYDAVESFTTAELEQRKIKNKRYDVIFPVMKTPSPDDVAVGGINEDEPTPSLIPSAESRLVVIGEVLNSKAILSNEKKGIYSEYSLRIQTVLKEDKERKLNVGEIITLDRAGGVIQYPSGQKILYFVKIHSPAQIPQS